MSIKLPDDSIDTTKTNLKGLTNDYCLKSIKEQFALGHEVSTIDRLRSFHDAMTYPPSVESSERYELSPDVDAVVMKLWATGTQTATAMNMEMTCKPK